MLRIVSVSAVLVAGVCASSALLAGGQAWAFDDEDDEEGPAEYVRICDAYGTGFFYIPGTETCLRISGGVRYSGIQQPSLLGASTTVIGGSEGFTVPAANWINRWGGDVAWEYGLGKNYFGDSFLGSYDAYLFGEAEFATGRANATGSSVVGVGGVTQIGLTHGMAIGGVTGLGSTLAGDGVTERNWVGSTWVRGMFGVGKSFLDDEDDEGPPAGFYVTPRLGLFVEHLNFSSQGRADITRGGAILAGFYQDYRSYAGDTYLGTVIGADLHYQVSPNARLTVGADILPAYHWGGANIDMQIGTGGGGAVDESYAFDKAGFTLGVSARAGVEFALARGWNAGIDYQWSLIPGVTALDKPAGPAFQPITATGRNVNRHEISLRLQRQF